MIATEECYATRPLAVVVECQYRGERRADETPGNRELTSHECRHGYAALMIAAGVNVKALSASGHSGIAIALDQYGHLLPGAEDEAASLLDALLAAESAARIPIRLRCRPQRSPRKARHSGVRPHVSRLMRRLSLVVVMTVAFAVPAALVPAAAAAHVPRGFVGMMIDGPMFPETKKGVDISKQMDKMVSAGVQSLRAVFDWSRTQPYAKWSEVPAADTAEFTDVAGVPTRFGPLDDLVQLAAEHGLTVLPVVIYAPTWDAALHRRVGSLRTPARNGPYAAFVSALVHRYGPHGTFWSDHSPKVPIRMWQIWNEPNLSHFWPQPFARSYVALVRAAHAAIKQADSSSKLVLGGLTSFSWVQLKSIYKIHGARSLFNVVAVHPYTAKPQGVITILKRIRGVMKHAGDASKPILATEISWPSSLGKIHQPGLFHIATTEAGQAKRIAQLLPLLGSYRRQLGLMGFDYYTWAGVERTSGSEFGYSGLFRFRHGSFVAKPAFSAFRKAALALTG